VAKKAQTLCAPAQRCENALTARCIAPQCRCMITKDQLHIGRVSLGLNVAQLARLADVAPNSIHGIERGFDFKASTMLALQAALEAKGILFRNGSVCERMVWEHTPPRDAKVRAGVLAVLNAGRKARGQAPYIDCEDE
jgi:hypothetical protein